MIMAELDVSWTQDERTEFLAKECRIKRDNANQIASKLAEQDFHTGKFGSFISEWQNNWEGCKGILLGIGFKEMDVVSFIAALRRHIEKQDKRANVDNNQKRPMCNELVWAVCKGIGVVKTSDRILLTSANIYAYLEKAFRKKLIYQNAITFLKTNIWSKFVIAIDHLEQNIEGKIVMKKNQEHEYELWANHLHIRLAQQYPRNASTVLFIHENALGNVHMHFFLQLIAPELRPFAVHLTDFHTRTLPPATACFLSTLHDCIEWVHLYPKQFSLEPINAVLNKFNKLKICIWLSMDEDQICQFCDAFIRWINTNNGGQPKMCDIDAQYEHEKIIRLLDAVNKDFAGATNKQPFGVLIMIETPADEESPLAEFTVRNDRTQEQLQLRRNGKGYMLIRQPITELDAYKQKQLLGREFGKLNKMSWIEITRLRSDDSD